MFATLMINITQHFTWNEAKCKDGTEVPDNLKENAILLADELEKLRTAIGDKPIIINSWYRTPAYNATLTGASPVSQHLQAKAADITIKDWKPKAVYDLIENLIRQGVMKEGGVGVYKTFTHYDIRENRSRWDMR